MAPAVWAAQQKKVTGKVVKVVDGDTFDLLDGKTTYRVRMYGIDAPEKKQDFGNRSKDALGEACKQQPITIVIRNKDRYQRFVADAYDAKGQRINVVMVKQGYAWYYEKFSPKDKELADAQQYAQKHRLGLWQQSKPIAPWDWRQLKKEEREQLKVAS
jgi:endonuclease YncB( thermonuclease family)